MVFTSFDYLLFFLPITILVTYLCSKINHKLAIIWTIMASLFFYAFWDLSYLPILLISIFFNYVCGRIIKTTSFKKRWLALGVSANLGLLVYFKYTNFAVNIISSIVGVNFHLQTIILPLALSFFTFQQISWLIDQCREDAPKCSFLEYTCAVSFFPHLIAGPIVQYHDLIPQFQNIKSFSPNWDTIAKGLFLIGCGVFKKIIIADTLSVYVNFGFDDAITLTILQAWMTILSYAMQIYFDFSGYCDIAIGSAYLIGIKLPDNFHSPYKSVSIREFWQRWHITLGSFLTRYLYFPLGGSQNGMTRTCINILIVMFLSGVWHGAGFGFILWGIAHGFAMVVQRLWNATGRQLPKIFSQTSTFLFVAVTWVLFRATDFTSATKVYRGMLGLDGVVLPHKLKSVIPDSWNMTYVQSTAELFGTETPIIQATWWALLAAFACVYVLREASYLWDVCLQRQSRCVYVLSIGAAFLLLFAFVKMITVPYREFIYFNF